MKRSNRRPGQVTHFANDRTTRGALLSWVIFVAVVLFLYWVFGAFESW